MIHRNYCWLVVLALCLPIGCSKFVPVEGTVTLDGQAVAGATVVFHPEDEQPGQRGGPYQASGATNEHGHFELTTINNEGVWPGWYKITVSKRELPPDLKKELEKTGTIRSQLPPGIDPKLLEEGKRRNTPMPMMQGNIPINPGDYMKEMLPEAYTSLKTTDLRFEVPKSGTKEANFDLKSKPP